MLWGCICINILAIPKASALMDFNGVGSIKCIGIKCVSNPLQKINKWIVSFRSRDGLQSKIGQSIANAENSISL